MNLQSLSNDYRTWRQELLNVISVLKGEPTFKPSVWRVAAIREDSSTSKPAPFTPNQRPFNDPVFGTVPLMSGASSFQFSWSGMTDIWSDMAKRLEAYTTAVVDNLETAAGDEMLQVYAAIMSDVTSIIGSNILTCADDVATIAANVLTGRSQTYTWLGIKKNESVWEAMSKGAQGSPLSSTIPVDPNNVGSMSQFAPDKYCSFVGCCVAMSWAMNLLKLAKNTLCQPINTGKMVVKQSDIDELWLTSVGRIYDATSNWQSTYDISPYGAEWGGWDSKSAVPPTNYFNDTAGTFADGYGTVNGVVRWYAALSSDFTDAATWKNVAQSVTQKIFSL